MSYPLHRRFIEKDIEDGSEQHPFLIKTAGDFQDFRNAIAAGNQFEGIYHKVVNDINLAEISFNPLPSTNNPITHYKGHFNGNFKTISNFSVTTNAVQNAAIFGSTMGGSIKKTKFTNMYIKFSGGGSSDVGCVAGHVANELIELCEFHGTIISNGQWATGGIIASCWGGNVTVKNCKTNLIVQTALQTGGIIATPSGSNITIESCLTLGTASGGNASNGGICMDRTSTTTIKNCVAAQSSISGSSGAARIVGGSSGSIINNYALDTMLVNGNIVTGSVTSNHGANATVQQLKSLAFYRDMMGWDMDIWTIDDGIDFPRLKGFNY